eukprot:TRINITY_DN62298_c0_g1_i1.p1 TRINITY_DN62298_c0_g1~~TRINITY_DN62298_c0_g1_i1.p1  ORF type:complete len:455 (+),score=60.24 TRINITY_DN62298_c0_g1_i1:122-1486(+)
MATSVASSGAAGAGGPNQSSWAADMRAYEREKRYNVEPHQVSGAMRNLPKGLIARREYAYDPLLGRFRDPAREAEQRRFEAEVTHGYMNMAKDLQVANQGEYNPITHEHMLAGVAESKPPNEWAGAAKVAFPTSAVDFNIVSNILHEDHHWGQPKHRPYAKERVPKRRMVPAQLHKDFNVLTNRYLQDHEVKQMRDQELARLEAAEKHRTANFFNPLTAKFVDSQMEERIRAAEDAHDTEIRLRGENSEPLTHRGNVTKGYDLITHRVHDPDLISHIVSAEHARKTRYATRHLAEQEVRQRDVEAEDALRQSKIDKTSHERYMETTRRGFDILTNQQFGSSRNQKARPPALTKPHADVWEKVFEHRDDLPLSARLPPRAPGHSGPSGSMSARGAPEVPTLRLPAQLSGPPSERSRRSETGSFRSRSSVSTARTPPPAPAVPGSPGGSVYSRRVA